MLYKHTILPFLEYAGFMLVFFTVDDRKNLQKCQNDALRICWKVRLNDHVRIDYLHEKCKLTSLEQRRRQQLLMLMYKKSTNTTMHKVFPRNTRQSTRVVFRTDKYEGGIYKRSPYFVGTKLRNKLPLNVIESPNMFVFRNNIRRLNKTYVDLLS